MRIGEIDFDAIRLTREDLAKVDAVLDSAVARLLDRVRNVVGVGRAHKWTGGLALRQACIQVQVSRKLPESALVAEDVIPATISGVPTDVVEVGAIEFQAQTAKVRPLQVGYSVGAQHNKLQPTGTLGAFVSGVVEKQQHFFILSNNHVLAANNAIPVGNAVTQPGPVDGGGLDDACGQLWRYVPMSTTADNQVDAAVATVEEDLIETIRPYVAEAIPAKDVTIGMTVIKNGRTTEVTAGVVTADHVTVMVTGADGSQYKMIDQFSATYNSAGGDSGSLVVCKANNKGVGLHFAGNSGVVAYMNAIENVLKALQVTLY
jgi:hypothetical protein